MKKLEKNMSAAEFSRLITKSAFEKCVLCYNVNGECVGFAKAGQCKAYDYLCRKQEE